MVLTDVIRGYVTLKSARVDYGVAIFEKDGTFVIDEEETGRLRKSTGSYSSLA
jgi:hypothetical protein